MSQMRDDELGLITSPAAEERLLTEPSTVPQPQPQTNSQGRDTTVAIELEEPNVRPASRCWLTNSCTYLAVGLPTVCAVKCSFLSSQYGFNSIFAEDKDTKLHPRPRAMYELIYFYTKMVFYHVLVFTIGFVLMVSYAIVIAFYSFTIAWIFNPILQSFLLWITPCLKLPMQLYVIMISPYADHLVKLCYRLCPEGLVCRHKH